MNVVVVESPAKAKTIERYLGSDFRVLATYGHVCDLPSKDGSVEPDRDFTMHYAVDPKSEKNLKAIAQAVKQSANLYLATDPDREGEAISWHVLNYLKDTGKLGDVDVGRVVFHEITKGAVLDAVAHPREINMDLVNAQQARRALDYLVGFTLSPVLWRKLPGSRSAGRVQSVALRMICEREAEIEAFVPQEYWTVDVDLATPAGAPVAARLTVLDGKKLEKFSLPDEASAKIAAAAIEQEAFVAAKIERRTVNRNPSAPFTTSTLQQEASRKLGMGAAQTMRSAQKLYEGVGIGGETVGLITYMRTDSVTLSNEATSATRSVIANDFGPTYLPEKPRTYRTKAKNAQEAHEAIRPTDPSRKPQEVAKYLDPRDAKLYELIWKRTVACQMASAQVDQVGVDFSSKDKAITLRATGSTIRFDGFLRVYSEGKDDGDASDGDRTLPPMSEGDAMERRAVKPGQHFTEPLPRYTEATLVKRMEELGIGRPSTYASIISVLQERDYVTLEKKRFQPQSRGRLVTAFLESFFDRYVQYDFTAELEDRLDSISNGNLAWKSVLQDFWVAFSMSIDDVAELRVKEVLDRLDEVLAPHIFPDKGDGTDARKCPSCADGRQNLKLGKFGAFVGCSNYPDCRFTRQLTNGGDQDGAISDGPKLLGKDGDIEINLKRGPYGLYVQREAENEGEKPKRVSIPKGFDAAQIDLEKALALLSLPRTVAAHPETGKPVLAGIGRYGPYVSHDGKYKSLPADDDVLTIGINRAVSLIAEAGKGRQKAEPIQVLGKHPEDEKEVAVYNGRYGPYIKHNSVFASVPKSSTPETITLEEALPLLAEAKAKKKPAKRAKAAKKPAAKTKAKKTTKAKTAAKKTPAKKPAAKKATKPAAQTEAT